MTPEAKVKQQIKKLLDAKGFWRAGALKPTNVVGWYYMPVSNGMGTVGIPDFVCCWRSRFFSIEAKKPGGKTTPNQDRRHDEIRAAGGTVLVIDDVNKLQTYFEGLT